MTFKHDILGKKMVVYLGSGGVGKTTVAAATALYSAQQGKKTLVITIDPAKRLADSLGIKTLGNDEVKIGENLYASMLDSKKTLDDLVMLHVTGDNDILNNPFYKGISEAIVGAQEYTAMGRLYEIYKHGGYDMIVVDTAPTKHALNFIKTPTRIVNVLDATLIQVLMKPAFLLQKATKFLGKKVEKIIGNKFLEDMLDFMSVFTEDTYKDFRNRALEMNKVLTDKDYSVFNIVCSAKKPSIVETLKAYGELEELSLPFGCFVVNKVHKSYQFGPEGKRLSTDKTVKRAMAKALKEIPAYAEYEEEQIEGAIDGILSNFCLNQDVASVEEENMQTLTELKHHIIKVPLFEQDVHDINGLKTVAGYLK